jgi:hypothetical protein
MYVRREGSKHFCSFSNKACNGMKNISQERRHGDKNCLKCLGKSFAFLVSAFAVIKNNDDLPFEWKYILFAFLLNCRLMYKHEMLQK